MNHWWPGSLCEPGYATPGLSELNHFKMFHGLDCFSHTVISDVCALVWYNIQLILYVYMYVCLFVNTVRCIIKFYEILQTYNHNSAYLLVVVDLLYAYTNKIIKLMFSLRTAQTSLNEQDPASKVFCSWLKSHLSHFCAHTILLQLQETWKKQDLHGVVGPLVKSSPKYAFFLFFLACFLNNLAPRYWPSHW